MFPVIQSEATDLEKVSNHRFEILRFAQDDVVFGTARLN
jgi:hypothetical protein